MTTARLIVHGVGYVCLGLVSWFLSRLIRARGADMGGVTKKWREDHDYHKGGY